MQSNADKCLFLDSETCGLHGMPVLLQYAVDDGPIILYDVWKEPIGKTLDLIEWMLTHTMVFFNASFDAFHLAKCYTTFRLCPRDWLPVDHIDEIALKEPEAQEGPCIKPVNCLDLMLHSRKGPYQSLMARSDVRIRRVPTPLAYALAEELENRVEIDGIYFARRADKDAPRWQVFDIKRRDGSIHPDLKDVVLRFSAAGGLKYLAEHALGYEPKYHFKDVELDTSFRPKELGYAPTALAVSNPKRNWEVYKTNSKGEREVAGYAWPGVIKHHIEHWATNAAAREYASDDIKYTRELYDHFGRPAAGDDDSVLACMVPVVRWRGFKIDIPGMEQLLEKATAAVDDSPVNVNKPPEVRRYVGACLDETEAMVIADSTKKANLIAISKWEIDADEPCTKCDGQITGTAAAWGTLDLSQDSTEADAREAYREKVMSAHPDHGGSSAAFIEVEKAWAVISNKAAQLSYCHRCEGTSVVKAGKHPAAVRAKELLDVKFAVKEKELYKKLLRAGKFHASFQVIGTLSSRMAGGDGLNAQGIKSTEEVRDMFPLAPDGYVLSIGDFSSFEITLADAVYNDPDLRAAILSGRKIHGLFGMCLFPGKTYEEILASAGTEDDMYVKGKSGVFALVYGGEWSTLVRNLGIAPEVAKKAFETWGEWFPRSAKARERTFKAFCSMSQANGTNVVWGEPADYIETFLGFRRYFTLENKITRALYELAKKPPKSWRDCKVKVLRNQHKGFQTAGGAVSSALYGAAFQIQAANQRAAANHEIQSPGGIITKAVQRRVWDLQPAGVHELLVMPANVHDEIICVNRPEMTTKVAETVRAGVESYWPQVPLLGMDWVLSADSWAGKKGDDDSGMVVIRPAKPEKVAA